MIPMNEGRGAARIAAELEEFFALARQWEAQLAASREVIKNLEAKVAEQEAVIRQMSEEAARTRTNLDALRAQEHTLRAQVIDQSRHLERLTQEREQGLSAQKRCTEMSRELKAIEQERDRVKGQLEFAHKQEKSYKDQLTEQSRQMDRMREEATRARNEMHEERRRRDLDLEIVRAQVDSFKRREELARSEAAAALKQVSSLQAQVVAASQTLTQYQTHWPEMQKRAQKAQLILADYEKLRGSQERARETMEIERRRLEDLDSMAKKDKRDKEIALKCLRDAEARIAELSRETEQLRDRLILRSIDDPLINLKF